MTRDLAEYAALAAVAMEVAPLRDLADWQPAGSLLESLASSLRGDGEGLSPEDLLRLRRWAGRWRRVEPAVRAFYASEVSEATETLGVVEAGLWAVLGARNDASRITGRQRAALRARWRDRYGYTPQVELAPTFAPTELDV